MTTPLWKHDLRLCRSAPRLVGVDEAGRGALAGPVVAAAVGLEAAFFKNRRCRERSQAIDDSKALSEEAREAQYALIGGLAAEGCLHFCWAAGTVPEIEEFNILGATRWAMQQALEALSAAGWELPRRRGEVVAPGQVELFCGVEESLGDPRDPPEVLVDGRPLTGFPFEHRAIVGGDGISLAIAMASIVAKVQRDRLMRELAKHFPGYGFEQHKGYGVPVHREALRTLGPCAEHRSVFLRKILGEDGGGGPFLPGSDWG